MRINDIEEGLAFFGSPCTKDCSGHLAGWKWERQKNRGTRAQTPSNSFNNGTEIVNRQAQKGSRPIGPMIRGTAGKFQKFQPIQEEEALDELTGVKKYHHLDSTQLMYQIAKDYNLKVLGSGVFGTVIQTKDPSIVVKVFDDDDAYLRFLEFTKQHPNPHYPRSKGLPKLMTAFYQRYDYQPDQFVVVQLEKLYPLDQKLANFCADMEYRDLDDVPSSTPGGLTNWDEYTYRQMAEDYPWIHSLMRAIQIINDANLGVGDLHADNFMQRKDGTIVINDPVVDENSSSLNAQWDRDEGTPHDVQGPHYRTSPAKKPGLMDRIKNKLVSEEELDELTGVKKYQDLTSDQLMHQIAREYGLKVLGSGVFGTVIQTRDPTIVVKVFDSDDAYLRFLEFARVYPNPHFPRAKSLPRMMRAFYKRFDFQPDEFVIVELEKLYPLDRNLGDFCADMGFRDLDDVPSDTPGGLTNWDEYTYRQMAEDYPWIPSLMRAIKIINNAGLGEDDLHSGNFMQRKDGTIVINDPVFDPESISWVANDASPYRDRMVQGSGPNKRVASTPDQYIFQ